MNDPVKLPEDGGALRREEDRYLRVATISRETAKVVSFIYPDLHVFEMSLVHSFRGATPMQIGEAVVTEYERNGRVITDPPGFPADVELRATVVRFFALVVEQWRNGQ